MINVKTYVEQVQM